MVVLGTTNFSELALSWESSVLTVLRLLQKALVAQEMPRNFAAAQALKRLQGVDEYPGTHSSGAPSRRHGRRPRGGQAPGMRGFPEGKFFHSMPHEFACEVSMSAG